MLYTQEYFNNVTGLLACIHSTQADAIQEAGQHMAAVLEKDGLVHVFGCGHSHMVGEELFYRAGGLANINAILDSAVMLHEGAAKSSQIERTAGLADTLLARYKTEPGEILLVASNSGINGYPVDMALAGKKRDLTVIGICSAGYRGEAAKHPSGKHLADVCDLCIDNCVNHGDASIAIDEDGQKAGPLSSIAAFFIANQMVLHACELLHQKGIQPRVFKSGNVAGSDAYNQTLTDAYRGRVRHL